MLVLLECLVAFSLASSGLSLGPEAATRPGGSPGPGRGPDPVAVGSGRHRDRPGARHSVRGRWGDPHGDGLARPLSGLAGSPCWVVPCWSCSRSPSRCRGSPAMSTPFPTASASASPRRAWRWGGRGWVCASGPRGSAIAPHLVHARAGGPACSCRPCRRRRRAASRCWCMSGRRWAPPTIRSGTRCSTATSPRSMRRVRSRPAIRPGAAARTSTSATTRQWRSTTRRPSSNSCSAPRRTMTCRVGSSPATRWKSAEWCPATRHVAFRRFNPARLRAFWEAYRQDATYNLTYRNCSSTVALALDCAIEGSLARHGVGALSAAAGPAQPGAVGRRPAAAAGANHGLDARHPARLRDGHARAAGSAGLGAPGPGAPALPRLAPALIAPRSRR